MTVPAGLPLWHHPPSLPGSCLPSNHKLPVSQQPKQIIHHTDCGAHAALYNPTAVAEHAKAKADQTLGTDLGGQLGKGGGTHGRRAASSSATYCPASLIPRLPLLAAGIDMHPIYGLDASVRGRDTDYFGVNGSMGCRLLLPHGLTVGAVWTPSPSSAWSVAASLHSIAGAGGCGKAAGIRPHQTQHRCAWHAVLRLAGKQHHAPGLVGGAQAPTYCCFPHPLCRTHTHTSDLRTRV